MQLIESRQFAKAWANGLYPTGSSPGANDADHAGVALPQGRSFFVAACLSEVDTLLHLPRWDAMSVIGYELTC